MLQEIKRDTYLQRLIDKKENGIIKVITGIRRCGKSYLLFRIYRDYLISQGVDAQQIIEIPMDDDEFLRYREPAELSKYIRSKLIDGKMNYVFIDEVQYAISNRELKNTNEVRLYNVLNGLLRLDNVDIYVTGSNSKLLTKDVLTAFRGRGDEGEYIRFPLRNIMLLQEARSRMPTRNMLCMAGFLLHYQ